VWLYEQSSLRIEGRIIGFDEFMNLVLDDAEEVPVAKGAAPAGPRRALGRILLKGGSPSRASQRACVPRAARVAAVCACVRRARVCHLLARLSLRALKFSFLFFFCCRR
jgi:small nuclear ribonucleoprotein (snRNP)-like protein